MKNLLETLQHAASLHTHANMISRRAVAKQHDAVRVWLERQPGRQWHMADNSRVVADHDGCRDILVRISLVAVTGGRVVFYGRAVEDDTPDIPIDLSVERCLHTYAFETALANGGAGALLRALPVLLSPNETEIPVTCSNPAAWP